MPALRCFAAARSAEQTLNSGLQLPQGLRAVLLNVTTSPAGSASTWGRKGSVETHIQT